MDFTSMLREEASSSPKVVVFPDGEEEKIQRAGEILIKSKFVKEVILIGNAQNIKETASHLNINLSMFRVIDPREYDDIEDFANEYFEIRRHKNISMDVARRQVLKPHFFGAMLVRKGIADGMVSGLNSATKPFIPAFQLIGVREGINRASSMFFMVFNDFTLYYADCGMNINPDEKTLAEIAITTANTVKQFGDEPRVALLSFSTRGSAKDKLVDKVRNACEIAKGMAPDIVIDGEIQFDAAFIPQICKKKAPDSPFVEKRANTFIFPDLDAGNISYKITERLAGAKAFGPIFQGIKKAVNDMSRGASVDDIVNIALITSIQAKYNEG